MLNLSDSTLANCYLQVEALQKFNAAFMSLEHGSETKMGSLAPLPEVNGTPTLFRSGTNWSNCVGIMEYDSSRFTTQDRHFIIFIAITRSNPPASEDLSLPQQAVQEVLAELHLEGFETAFQQRELHSIKAWLLRCNGLHSALEQDLASMRFEELLELGLSMVACGQLLRCLMLLEVWRSMLNRVQFAFSPRSNAISCWQRFRRSSRQRMVLWGPNANAEELQFQTCSTKIA